MSKDPSETNIRNEKPSSMELVRTVCILNRPAVSYLNKGGKGLTSLNTV